MTRTQFILGMALLCVSGTLSFFISFRGQEKSRKEIAPTGLSQHSQRNHRAMPLPLSKRKVEKMNATNYEISVSNFEIQDLGDRIQADSRQRLQDMTARYQLTSNQRREIFPLLVSHHPDFQQGLVVNGSASVSASETGLASEVYPLLDLVQQEAYQADLLSDHDWWGEIIGQLRGELDAAFDAGEVDLITERIDTLPSSSELDRNDGREVEKPSIDFSDFLGN